MLVYGKRLYGVVDKVPGGFSVQTLFGHLWFLPLVPIESWLVFEKTREGWRGIKLESISWRSVLFCWGRAALAIAGAMCALGMLEGFGIDSSRPVSWGIALACFGALAWSYRASRATYERAIAVVREHRLGPQFEATVEASFGRAVSPAIL